MIQLLAAALAAICVLAAFMAGVTALYARRVERRHPPVGRFVDVGGTTLHVLERGGGSDEPPVVFIHGASGNLLDQAAAFASAFAPDQRLIFVDRPGHGHSRRTHPAQASPIEQARVLGALLDRLGIERAVWVGHSYGGAVALAAALERADKVAGLVLLSPASHPWPGAETAWHYRLASRPLLGRLFAHTLLVPLSIRRVPCAVNGVFSPQPVPKDYVEQSGTALAIRPESFIDNAHDITELHAVLGGMEARYGEIEAPTAIITGDTDTIVWPSIHSAQLVRDLKSARLAVLRNVGHKPDFAATDLVRDAVDAVSRGELPDFPPETRLGASALAEEGRVPSEADGVREVEREHPIGIGVLTPAGQDGA